MFSSIKNKNVALTYFGINTDEITTSLIGLATQEKAEDKSKKSILKKTPVIIAECFQNIIRHGEQVKLNENKYFKECFQIKSGNGYIAISSVNLILNANIEKMSASLERVNELSKEELKELRKQLLQKNTFTEKGGAGLGIVEMSYRTGNKLESKFTKIDDHYSKFFLSMTIGRADAFAPSIDEIEDEYEQFKERAILMLYKGDFSWETSSFLIEMLHENFASDEQITNQLLKEITVILEMIQNMAKHALPIDGIKEGVFALFSENDKRSLYCGNYISKENAAVFRQRCALIEEQDQDGLRALYRKELLENELDAEANAGLGLIEIARQANSRMGYSIYEDKKGQLYLAQEIDLNK